MIRMWIDWLDLPKLTKLRTIDYSSSDYSGTFYRPRYIVLESDSHPLWMMFRHAQTHQCVSQFQICIQVQDRRHNHGKYLLHPSLTNRHRRSSELHLITESHVTPLFVPHTTHNTHFPSTSELIQRHSRERYRCANTEIMTIRIRNDGNPIRIVETESNDHSLRIAYNQRHFAFQITHITSPFQWEPKPNHSTMTTQSPTLPHNSLFHRFQPINPIQVSILSQLPHYRNTHKSNHPHITLASNNTPKRRTSPFPTPLPKSLSPHPTAITQSLHHVNA